MIENFNYRKSQTMPGCVKDITGQNLFGIDFYKVFNTDCQYGIAYNKNDWNMAVNPDYSILIDREWDDVDALFTYYGTYFVARKQSELYLFSALAQEIPVKAAPNSSWFSLSLTAQKVTEQKFDDITIDNENPEIIILTSQDGTLYYDTRADILSDTMPQLNTETDTNDCLFYDIRIQEIPEDDMQIVDTPSSQPNPLPAPIEELKNQHCAQCRLAGEYEDGEVYELTVAECFRWTTKIKHCLVFYSVEKNETSQTPFFESY